MKKIIFILPLFISFSFFSLAQNSHDKAVREEVRKSNQNTELALITATLMNYIEGTSYNQMERIEKAFYPEANLYLDNREKQLWVVPIAEYMGFFKDKKYGEFNGRIGKILSIDHFGNIAQAKVEILIPTPNLRFVDMFILKKIKGDWKIISKTANSEKSEKKGERILFIVSNAHYYGVSNIGTGNSFSEIVNAYDTFNQANFTVDFVSPNGGAIPLGYISTSDTLQKKHLYNSDFMYSLEHTKNPHQIDPNNYSAVYYVGGGSAMYGVPENEDIQKIAMHIYEENKGVISSVCHGTAGIVNLKTKDGKYLVAGKNVNGYPDAYENHQSEHYKQFPFKIQQTIEERGGTFRYSERNTPHVEVEGKLITGQNHLSSKMVATKIIEYLRSNNKSIE